MTLYMIGLGLGDEKDITLKGLEAIRRCSHVFLEGYTSVLKAGIEDLERLYGKPVVLADRDMVESRSDDILKEAKESDVAFLVVGDVFSATTHIDLFLRAREKGILVQAIHNTSIMTAIGMVGLELYKYGKTTSMPYFEKSFTPHTAYDVIKQNLALGWHTLMLLDIKRDQERFMSVGEALYQLLEIEAARKEGLISRETRVVGCARLGQPDFLIRYAKIEDLLVTDFGKPLHCIVIPGKLHFMEEDMLKHWS